MKPVLVYASTLLVKKSKQKYSYYTFNNLIHKKLYNGNILNKSIKKSKFEYQHIRDAVWTQWCTELPISKFHKTKEDTEKCIYKRIHFVLGQLFVHLNHDHWTEGVVKDEVARATKNGSPD